MTTCRAGAVLIASVCAAGPAFAAERWGVVSLPGGVTAARQVLDLGHADRPPVMFLMDLARRLHGTPIRENPELAARLGAYVDYLERLRRNLDQWPTGLSLASIDVDRRRRDAVRDTLAELGLRLDSRDGKFAVTPGRDDDDRRRAAWLRAVGADVASVAEALTRGETVTITWPTDELPLPLAYAWPSALREPGAPVLSRIVADPKALLFYVGLMNLDTATADWLGTQPALIRRLYEDLAGPFAAFGRSVRVRDGRIDVPGEAAAGLWQDLVGEAVTPPETFVRRLFDRDAGRLAYFYDAVATLDPARRDFLLGAHLVREPGGRNQDRDRRRFVRAIYDRFAAVEPNWKAAEQPFVRPNLEPGLATAVLDVSVDGLVGPDWWPALFERVVEMSWPDRIEARKLARGRADADWLLWWIFGTPAEARDRFAMIRFAQRVFADAPESSAPAMTIALLALRDMPPLALSLERMGIRDPATYAQVAMASRRLTYAGDAGEMVPVLRAWQGALAVIEQLTRHRSFAPVFIHALVQSLAEALPARAAGANVAIATWMLDRLLPALGASTPTQETSEAATIAELLRRDPAADTTLTWEGIAYRIDLEGPSVESAAAIRDAMPGPRMRHLAVLRDAATRLGGKVATVAELDRIAAALAEIVPGLEEVMDLRGKTVDAAGGLAEAVRNLQRIREPRNLARASREQRRVVAALEAAVPEIAVGLAHALAMAPITGPPRLYAEAGRFHGFDTANLDGQWRARAWAPAVVSPRIGGGTGLTGAILGIDLARASEHLRPLPRQGEVGRPTISDVDQRAMTERVVLRAKALDWQASGAEVAAAIGRGRSTLAGWIGRTPAEEDLERALADATVDSWRSGLARFLIVRGRAAEVAGLLTMTDLYRLGSDEALDAAWGPSSQLVDGCWCLARPVREPDEFWLNRRLSHAATVTLDLQLRLAELLDASRLPHDLIEPLLPMAVQDVVDQAEQLVTDDREALAWPRRLGEDRLEAYLLDLLARHVLTSPRAGRMPADRR